MAYLKSPHDLVDLVHQELDVELVYNPSMDAFVTPAGSAIAGYMAASMEKEAFIYAVKQLVYEEHMAKASPFASYTAAAQGIVYYPPSILPTGTSPQYSSLNSILKEYQQVPTSYDKLYKVGLVGPPPAPMIDQPELSCLFEGCQEPVVFVKWHPIDGYEMRACHAHKHNFGGGRE